jgi:hypothetical protein
MGKVVRSPRSNLARGSSGIFVVAETRDERETAPQAAFVSK